MPIRLSTRTDMSPMLNIADLILQKESHRVMSAARVPMLSEIRMESLAHHALEALYRQLNGQLRQYSCRPILE